MFHQKTMCAAVLLGLLTGCASQPDKIATQYVSPSQYQNHDCEQLAGEMTRVSKRASELQSSIKKDADNDTAQMTVGLILFWPALFFLEGGDGAAANEFARLKGERDALETAAVMRKCDPAAMPQFEEPPAVPAEEPARNCLQLDPHCVST